MVILQRINIFDWRVFFPLWIVKQASQDNILCGFPGPSTFSPLASSVMAKSRSCSPAFCPPPVIFFFPPTARLILLQQISPPLLGTPQEVKPMSIDGVPITRRFSSLEGCSPVGSRITPVVPFPSPTTSTAPTNRPCSPFTPLHRVLIRPFLLTPRWNLRISGFLKKFSFFLNHQEYIDPLLFLSSPLLFPLLVGARSTERPQYLQSPSICLSHPFRIP